MAASDTLSHSPTFRKSSGVLVLNGWGIQARVDRGHLLCHDGIADERRTIRLPRVASGLRRLVCIGSDGFITLEAIRWISDVGASFVMLDRRGKVITVCNPNSPSSARLRRSQSLALTNGTALRISKELIRQKLEGQAAVVRDMLSDFDAANAINKFSAELPSAESIESVRLIESQAGRTYWGSWADVPVRWPKKDEHRIPEHWKHFGSRISPITGSPRLAATPPNAVANLLYGRTEAEARIAAVAMGMDPDIGMLHVDTPNRSSLACDLQEPLRPKVDAFILNWLQTEPLRKGDFWEERNGNCRICTPLVIKLCETADTWRRLVAPVAEYVAQELWSSISSASKRPLATRLTQRTKREVKGSEVHEVKHTRPEHVCQGCGKKIRIGRTHCGRCAIESATNRLADAARIGRIAAHDPEARAKHSATRKRHAQACTAWDASSQPAWLTAKLYSEKIQPLLAHSSASAIAKQIGVSRWYAGRIREGYRPHPRHWVLLATLVGSFPASKLEATESLP
jgi:CRISPR-associated protein Cas1